MPPCSEETKAKLREAARNRGEDWKRKQRETHLGKKRGPYSAAHRRAISEGLKGHVVSEETKAHMRKPKSEAHKLKMSEVNKGKRYSEEYKRRHSENQMGKPHPHRGAPRPKSEATFGLIAKSHSKTLRTKRPPPGEALLMQELLRLKIPFAWQHPLGRYIADFVLPDYKLNIEVDDHWYHRRNDRQPRQIKRDEQIEKRFGLKVIRLKSENLPNLESLGQHEKQS